MKPSARRRQRPLNLESLEPRLALATDVDLIDTTPPAAWSPTDAFGDDVSLPVQSAPAIGKSLDLSVNGSRSIASSLAHNQAKNGEIYAAVSDSGSFQIWAFTPDGQSRRQLTFQERDGLARASHPSVSPDGTLVAFSGVTADRADVYVINADGTNLRKLTSSNANEYQFIPAFSPDGRLIAYTSSRGEPTSATAHLRIMSVDGSGDRQLTPTTDGSYEDTGPKFSPRGENFGPVSS